MTGATEVGAAAVLDKCGICGSPYGDDDLLLAGEGPGKGLLALKVVAIKFSECSVALEDGGATGPRSVLCPVCRALAIEHGLCKVQLVAARAYLRSTGEASPPKEGDPELAWWRKGWLALQESVGEGGSDDAIPVTYWRVFESFHRQDIAPAAPARSDDRGPAPPRGATAAARLPLAPPPAILRSAEAVKGEGLRTKRAALERERGILVLTLLEAGLFAVSAALEPVRLSSGADWQFGPAPVSLTSGLDWQHWTLFVGFWVVAYLDELFQDALERHEKAIGVALPGPSLRRGRRVFLWVLAFLSLYASSLQRVGDFLSFDGGFAFTGAGVLIGFVWASFRLSEARSREVS